MKFVSSDKQINGKLQFIWCGFLLLFIIGEFFGGEEFGVVFAFVLFIHFLVGFFG